VKLSGSVYQISICQSPPRQRTLDFRRSMTEEEYVALHGQDDAAYEAEMARRLAER
jgi:hypothetical protein